jgi:hypothetical protein
MDAHQEALSHRAVSMLRAVRDGRGQVTIGSEPDLYVDGLPVCDQQTARALAHHDLVAPVCPGPIGERVPADLTGKGREILASAVPGRC